MSYSGLSFVTKLSHFLFSWSTSKVSSVTTGWQVSKMPLSSWFSLYIILGRKSHQINLPRPQERWSYAIIVYICVSFNGLPGGFEKERGSFMSARIWHGCVTSPKATENHWMIIPTLKKEHISRWEYEEGYNWRKQSHG